MVEEDEVGARPMPNRPLNASARVVSRNNATTTLKMLRQNPAMDEISLGEGARLEDTIACKAGKASETDNFLSVLLNTIDNLAKLLLASCRC